MMLAEAEQAGRAEIPGFEHLGRSDLKAAWEKAFGSSPPAYLSLRFMRRALIYDAQCKAFGGLSAAQRRQLKTIASGKTGSTASSGSLSPGSHLVRDWNGRSYQVEVVEGGFRFDGKTYRSLTAIATRITGAKWSGPRFFGVS
jgi:hypothetical protein